MGLKFRRGSTAQQSGSLAFGEPYVNTTLGTLVVGGATGDIVLSAGGTGSTGNFGAISGSGLDITGNANIAGNLTLGGTITIGDNPSDNVVVNADLSSSIIPNNDNAFDLGSASYRYRTLYATNIYGAVYATNNVISSSAQTIANLPTGVVSGSSQTTANLPTGVVSGSSQITYLSISSIPVGIVSSSAQTIANLPTGVISGSSQLSGTTITDLTIVNLTTVNETASVLFSSGSNTFGDFGDDTHSFTGSVKISGSFTLVGSSTATSYNGTINANNSVVSSSAQVTPLLPTGTLSGSSQVDATATTNWSTGIKTQLNTNTVVSGSSQVTLSSTTGFPTYDSALATITGSLITSASTLTQRVAANEAVSGTFARTNSTNTFNGAQTISGSLTVTQDLIILGSSSIQNISSSNLVIGAAYVTLNANSPSSRYAGIDIIDSGSAGGSGSLWYDAVQDEFIQVHKGNGTNVTSSHFVQGPQTYDNLGNELYLTNNRLTKGTGLEHIVDSNITDTGTLITLGSNTYVNGTFYATGTVLVSGSSQITYANISSIPGGIVSGSSQVDATATTNWSTGIKTRLDANTVISGSSQVTLSSTTGYGTVINQNLLTTSDVRHNSLGIGMAASATAGRIDASGDIVAYSTSDMRFKDNITPIDNAIQKIRMISGNTYDWKVDMKEFHGFEGNDVGVIAQEIEAVLPQLVTTRETGYKAVKYDKLVALLIEGMKEQQHQLDNLSIEFENLKKSKGL